MNFLSFFKQIVALTLGWFVFMFYMARYAPYRGAQEMHRLLQKSPSGLCAKALNVYLFNDYAAKKKQLQRDVAFVRANQDKERLSDIVVSQYSDDSLKGYGDYHYNKGGDTLQEQQRGLILPILEAFLEKENALTVAEIGTANGDVLAYLAEKYPSHNFNGIDFSVKTALYKHKGRKNLMFTKGYALDLLENGDLKCDAVFFSSTLLVFTPKELQAYFEKLKQAGCKYIFINEPYWAGLTVDEASEPYSEHLEGAVWYHNYLAYLKQAGFSCDEVKILESYKHPKSQRQDLQVLICRASAQ